MNNAEKIGELLFRHTRQKTSSKEEEELYNWRQLSHRNEEIFQNAVNPEKLRIKMKRIDEGRKLVFSKLQNQFPEILLQKPQLKHPLSYQIMRLAAILLLVLGSFLYKLNKNFGFNERDFIQPGSYTANIISSDGVITALDDLHRGWLAGWANIKLEEDRNGNLIYIVPTDSTSTKEKTVCLYTPRGGVFSLRLPDNTMIWLNAESSITYPANTYNDSIKIFIKGEAYFEIAPQSKPYIISFANKKLIKSTGSHFDLMAYPGEATIITDVIGSIDIVSWKNGFTTFHNVPIQTIMQSVGRWYNAKVIYQGKLTNKRYIINMPRNAKFYDLLLKLEMQGARFKIEGRTIIVL